MAGILKGIVKTSDIQTKSRAANLLKGKRFKPGQSGNPKGRPKKEVCLTSQLKDRLDEVPKVLPDGSPNNRELTWAGIISERVVLEAAKGNPSIIKELLERIDGKVKDKLDVRANFDDKEPTKQEWEEFWKQQKEAGHGLDVESIQA